MPKRIFRSLANLMIFLISQNEYILGSLLGITLISLTDNQFQLNSLICLEIIVSIAPTISY